MNFIKKLFIAEFDGTWKKRYDFFSFQFVNIFSFFSLLTIIYFFYFFIDALNFNYCYSWITCFQKEKELFFRMEIFSNILFLMVLGFIYKINTCNVERFSFLKYWKKFQDFFEFIFTILKISIIAIILFFLLNFICIFYQKNYFYFYNLLEKTENISWFLPLFYSIFFIEIVLFLIWFILPKNKKFYNLKK